MCTFWLQPIILHTLLHGGFISISVTSVNHRFGVLVVDVSRPNQASQEDARTTLPHVPPPSGDQGPAFPLLFSVGVLFGSL